jgi:hypothetical protein
MELPFTNGEAYDIRTAGRNTAQDEIAVTRRDEAATRGYQAMP